MIIQATHHKKIPAVILAGGCGERMGGRDKCLLPLGERTLLAHIVQRLSGQCSAIYLNANGDATRFNEYGLEVIPDQHMPAIGPLGGLHSGLLHTVHSEPENKASPQWLLTVPGDCPFLPEDLLARLIKASDSSTEVVYCHSAGRDHFVVALWSCNIVPKLAAFIGSGKRSVSAFIQTLSHQYVEFEKDNTFDIDPFFNINTHEQWQHAVTLLASHG